MTLIPNPLQSTALARPHHPVVVMGDQQLTAAALAEKVLERASWLASMGIGSGSVVALVGPPSLDWIVYFHALGWVGATVMPLPAAAPRLEYERMLTVVEPKCLLLVGAVSDGTEASLKSLRAFKVMRVEHRDESFASAPSAPCPERFWPLDEARVVLLTSGTSAVPRPVWLSTSQLVFSAFGSAIRLGHLPDDRWLVCLPFHHVGGLSIVWRCAWYGTTVQLMPRFDAEEVARLLFEGSVTLVSLVPAMLTKILDTRPGQKFPSTLRAILLGGAPANEKLLERCRAIQAPVSLTWGMTETAAQVTTRMPGDLSGDAGSGAPLAFARVESRNGVLMVRGPVVHTPLITGDRGNVDSLGRVHVDGRRDDIIISGGENIAPDEVESVLLQHGSIVDAGVVGVADAQWGQRPVAVLVGVANEQRPSDAELREFCRARLAAFKIPERFIWCSALPRDELGKLRRRQLLPVVANGDQLQACKVGVEGAGDGVKAGG